MTEFITDDYIKELQVKSEQRKQAYFEHTQAMRTALTAVIDSKKTLIRDRLKACELLMEIIKRGENA